MDTCLFTGADLGADKVGHTVQRALGCRMRVKALLTAEQKQAAADELGDRRPGRCSPQSAGPELPPGRSSAAAVRRRSPRRTAVRRDARRMGQR